MEEVGKSDTNIDGAGVAMCAAVLGTCEGKGAFVDSVEGITDGAFTTGASDSGEVTGANVIGAPVSRVGYAVGSTVGWSVGIDVGVTEDRIVGLIDGDIEWSALGLSSEG